MSDYFLGEIRMFSLPYTPTGWLDCNGQILQVQQYQALFSLLGKLYGGDGYATFGLPDLRGRVAVGVGSTTPYALGSKGGAETVTLQTANLPVHNHLVQVKTTDGTNPDAEGALMAAASQGTDGGGGSAPAPNIYGPPGNGVALNAAVVAPTGGNGAHNNLQPFTTLRFCIATSGLYPSFS